MKNLLKESILIGLIHNVDGIISSCYAKLTEQDVWAPPFGRRRLGAAVWAHGRLGAGRLGAGLYTRGNWIL